MRLSVCVHLSFLARAVHQQGVCVCAEPELQLGLVAHVSLPAHLCPRITHGKKETEGSRGRREGGSKEGGRKQSDWSSSQW